MTADGAHAIAADPDRDAVYGIDLLHSRVIFTVALQAGDEPGRIAEDGSGNVHVALRRGGALVTLNESTGAVIARRNVCPAPRGVAWDRTTNLVWVACATGELVALPAGGGSATQTLKVERDLRDVIVDNGTLSITELRSAQVLRLGANGAIARRDPLPVLPESGTVSHVAWRAIAGGAGTIVATYQNETTSDVSTQVQGGYGGGCGAASGPLLPPLVSEPPPVVVDAGDAGDAGESGIAADDAGLFGPGFDAGGPSGFFDAGCPGPVVASVLAILDGSGNTLAQTVLPGVLPVDVARSRDGQMLAVVTPGSAYAGGLPTVMTLAGTGASLGVSGGASLVDTSGFSVQPIAVAIDAAGNVLVQTREPAALWISNTTGAFGQLPLSSKPRSDTGVDVFHTQAGADIACASCHPEGGDDGHVWTLDGNARRTPSLRGTIAGTAPYHWPGDEPTMDALLADVYEVRMDGAPLDPGQSAAIEGWVNAIPAPPAPSWIDAASAKRGQALFAGSTTRCSTCHSGAKLTDNLTVDVGTGGSFQVPPLIGVGWRTPLLHDGCATTIADRFGSCATPQHGSIGSLSAQDLTDLETYLESL